MKRSVPFLSVVALGGALLLTGCQSNSYSCSDGRCHVTVDGAGQSVKVNNVNVTVSQISSDGMTVSAGGSAPTTLGNGESSQVGPLMIKITSIDGQKVEFDVR